jgi:hypothetical protein
MTVEYIRTSRDNTIDLLLSDDGAAINLSAVNKIMISFDESTGMRNIESTDKVSGDIRWAQDGYQTGEIRFFLGTLSTAIEDGRYDAPIVIYDPSTMDDGVYMGTVEIDVPRISTLELFTNPASVNCNSYCSLAEADAYHDTQIYNGNWREAVTEVQKQGLLMATRLLDQLCRWQGTALYDDQPLLWPRQYVYTRNGDLIDSSAEFPDWLRDATAEFARHLITGDRTLDETEGLFGFEEAKLGPMAIKLNPDLRSQKKSIMPKSVWLFVRPYCQKLGRKTHLVRT